MRLILFNMRAPDYLLVVESQCWIYAMLSFGSQYLNRDGKVLRYLSLAAYPVYIMHMIFLYLASMIIFPLEVVIPVKFALVLLFVFVP